MTFIAFILVMILAGVCYMQMRYIDRLTSLLFPTSVENKDIVVEPSERLGFGEESEEDYEPIYKGVSPSVEDIAAAKNAFSEKMQ